MRGRVGRDEGVQGLRGSDGNEERYSLLVVTVLLASTGTLLLVTLASINFHTRPGGWLNTQSLRIQEKHGQLYNLVGMRVER